MPIPAVAKDGPAPPSTFIFGSHQYTSAAANRHHRRSGTSCATFTALHGHQSVVTQKRRIEQQRTPPLPAAEPPLKAVDPLPPR